MDKNECKLVELALRERWNIPDSTRESIMRELASILEDDGLMRRKPRLYLQCVKALAGLSRLSLSAIDTALRAKAVEEMEAALREVEGLAGGSAPGSTGGPAP